MPTPAYLKESDIRTGLKKGGSIRGCFVIARIMPKAYEFLPYIRPSWQRAHLPLYTWRGKEIRTYRDIGRFINLIRDEFGFVGSIHIHFPKTPELARFKFLLPEDEPPEGTIPSPGAAED